MIGKRALRQLIRLEKQQHHSSDESVAIIKRLKQEKHFSDAYTLLIYNALPDEVQTQQLLDELVAMNKTVLLPKVINSTDMELRYYTGRQDLTLGAYDILEPTGKIFTNYEMIDVAVIPGMAFDTQGHRLGRGRGYYDRFLANISDNVFKIGLCFPWQIVESVPTEENDIPMDLVIC